MSDGPSIIGPPDREPDTLAPGFKWCPTCGLHQFPQVTGFYVTRAATACPVCRPDLYTDRVQAKPVVHVVTWMTDDSQRMPQEAS